MSQPLRIQLLCLNKFAKDFWLIKVELIKEDLEWAEKALTWANILLHRAKLA